MGSLVLYPDTIPTPSAASPPLTELSTMRIYVWSLETFNCQFTIWRARCVRGLGAVAVVVLVQTPGVPFTSFDSAPQLGDEQILNYLFRLRRRCEW